MRPLLPIATLMALLLGSTLSLPAAADVAENIDSQAIIAQQQDIRAKASTRQERYRDMEESRKKELFAHQDSVTRLLRGTTRTTELSDRDQITLFNSLEAIAAIINQAEDERMVCERSKPIGSNRPQTLCKTLAQRRAERQEVEAARGRRDSRCIDAWSSGACKLN